MLFNKVRKFSVVLFLTLFATVLTAQHSEPNPQNALKKSEKEEKSYQEISDSIHSNYTYYSYPESLANLHQIASAAKENKDAMLFSTTTYYIASLYHKLENYDGVVAFTKQYIEAEELPTEVKNSFLPAAYILRAEVHLENNEIEEAKKLLSKLYKDSLVLFRSTTFKLKLLETNILIAKGKPEKALDTLTKLESRLKQIENPYVISKYNLSKAKALTKLNEWEQAKNVAFEVKKLSEANNYALLELRALEILVEAHQQLNDTAKAFQYSNELNELNKKIIKFQNNQFNYNKALSKGDMENALSTIKYLEEENKKKDKFLKFNKYTIIFSGLFLLFMALFTVALYKNNRIRGKANNLLYTKNKELILSNKQVMLSSKHKDQFLSTITHELRTPIYAITGLTHLLLDDKNLTEKQEEYLKSLKYSGEHLLSLVNNVLDLNKLDSGKMKLINYNFNLRKKLENIVKTLNRSAEEKKTELHYEYDENIPETLNGDIGKVSQILINLIGNAVKFTEDGDVWLRCKLKGEDAKKTSVYFEVEDNGIGIAEDKKEAIFENFNQGDVHTDPNIAGTGLGLPIVKNLLKLLGSEVYLESELGKGSTFSFTVDFNTINQKRNDNFEKFKSKFVVSEEKLLKMFEGKNALIVEDNKLNQTITKKILEKKGFNCEVAENGQISVDLVEKNTYDFVLMDIHMPVMNGIEATKIIREDHKDLPIIALTAITLEEDKDEFLKKGFTEIIPKPYETKMFFEKIYYVLKNSSSNTVA